MQNDPSQRPSGNIEMIEIWAFADRSLGDIDITGFSVEATDGKIGKIDEASYDDTSSYVVVDTGPWIFGKKVVLPAGVIDRVDLDSETVFVNRMKDEIKDAPEYDPDRGLDAAYRGELGDYYTGYNR